MNVPDVYDYQDNLASQHEINITYNTNNKEYDYNIFNLFLFLVIIICIILLIIKIIKKNIYK